MARRNSGLPERRHVRQLGQAAGAEDRQGADLAGLDVRRRDTHGRHQHLRVVAEQGRHRRAAPGGRQVAHRHAGGAEEHLGRDVQRAVEPGGADGDLTRAPARVVEQLGQGPPRRRPADDEDRRVGADPRDRRELVARDFGGRPKRASPSGKIEIDTMCAWSV